jgi:hypothetical protein
LQNFTVYAGKRSIVTGDPTIKRGPPFLPYPGIERNPLPPDPPDRTTTYNCSGGESCGRRQESLTAVHLHAAPEPDAYNGLITGKMKHSLSPGFHGERNFRTKNAMNSRIIPGVSLELVKRFTLFQTSRFCSFSDVKPWKFSLSINHILLYVMAP